MPVETNQSSSQSARTAEGGPSSAIGNPGGSIQEAMEQTRGRLNTAYAALQQRSNEVLEGAEGYVQEHPAQAIIYAASVGAVIGLVAGLILGERSDGAWHRRWW